MGVQISAYGRRIHGRRSEEMQPAPSFVPVRRCTAYVGTYGVKRRRIQLKKITTILLAVIILTVFPAAAWGLNTPAVSRNHGVVTARFIGDLGLFLGAEYGVTSELALLAELGPKEMSRIGLKYQVGRMAVTGGVTGSAVFFGLNGSGA